MSATSLTIIVGLVLPILALALLGCVPRFLAVGITVGLLEQIGSCHVPRTTALTPCALLVTTRFLALPRDGLGGFAGGGVSLLECEGAVLHMQGGVTLGPSGLVVFTCCVFVCASGISDEHFMAVLLPFLYNLGVGVNQRDEAESQQGTEYSPHAINWTGEDGRKY